MTLNTTFHREWEDDICFLYFQKLTYTIKGMKIYFYLLLESAGHVDYKLLS